MHSLIYLSLQHMSSCLYDSDCDVGLSLERERSVVVLDPFAARWVALVLIHRCRCYPSGLWLICDSHGGNRIPCIDSFLPSGGPVRIEAVTSRSLCDDLIFMPNAPPGGVVSGRRSTHTRRLVGTCCIKSMYHCCRRARIRAWNTGQPMGKERGGLSLFLLISLSPLLLPTKHHHHHITSLSPRIPTVNRYLRESALRPKTKGTFSRRFPLEKRRPTTFTLSLNSFKTMRKGGVGHQEV